MSRIKKSKWSLLADFVNLRFKIPKSIFSLASADFLLSKCAMGISNKSLEAAYGYDIPYLEFIFTKYFGFKGWEEDLDINPLLVYNTPSQVESMSTQVAFAVGVAKKYSEYRKELDKYYGD